MRYTKKQIQEFLNSAPGRKATNEAHDSGYNYGVKVGKREVSEAIIQALDLTSVLEDVENRIGTLEANR